MLLLLLLLHAAAAAASSSSSREKERESERTKGWLVINCIAHRVQHPPLRYGV